MYRLATILLELRELLRIMMSFDVGNNSGSLMALVQYLHDKQMQCGESFVVLGCLLSTVPHTWWDSDQRFTVFVRRSAEFPLEWWGCVGVAAALIFQALFHAVLRV